MIIEFIGGHLDGTLWEVPRSLREIRVSVRKDVTSPIIESLSPTVILHVVEVWGPATEADEALHRWSLLRVDQP